MSIIIVLQTAECGRSIFYKLSTNFCGLFLSFFLGGWVCVAPRRCGHTFMGKQNKHTFITQLERSLPSPSHCQLGDSSSKTPLLWFFFWLLLFFQGRRVTSGSGSRKQNVLFDRERFPPRLPYNLFFGGWGGGGQREGCGDSTQTLGRCSYMTHADLSRPDGAESSPPLFLRPGQAAVPRRWCRCCAMEHNEPPTSTLPASCLQYVGLGAAQGAGLECRAMMFKKEKKKNKKT